MCEALRVLMADELNEERMEGQREGRVEGQREGQIRAYASPVSYTHLDVYKRQYQISGCEPVNVEEMRYGDGDLTTVTSITGAKYEQKKACLLYTSCCPYGF